MLTKRPYVRESELDYLKTEYSHFLDVVIQTERDAKEMLLSVFLGTIYMKAFQITERATVLNIQEEEDSSEDLDEGEEPYKYTIVTFAFCSSASTTKFMKTIAGHRMVHPEGANKGTAEVIEIENIKSRDDLTPKEIEDLYYFDEELVISL